jgi:hypothetical protein
MSLMNLTSRRAVLTAMAECDRLGRTDFLKKYGFGKATKFMVRHPTKGLLYDSKAIAGAAHGVQFRSRGPLTHTQFSGGEDTVAARLRLMRFEVVQIGGDWTAREVELVVTDYFSMLRKETEGQIYVKAEHNRALSERIRQRTKASIELKHQNISAVLHSAGAPYIEGYKPRPNAQRLLRDVVLRFLSRSRMSKELDTTRIRKRVADWDAVVVAPPKPTPYVQAKKKLRIPRKFDFAQRDDKNRKLGRAGEHWVVRLEKRRLLQAGRKDLADQIKWISDSLGDGAGYDISSFEKGGQSRFIEVKTTNSNVKTPFLVSRNEVEFSEESGRRFFLYRVFEFSSNARLFVLRGPISKTTNLECEEFRARVK